MSPIRPPRLATLGLLSLSAALASLADGAGAAQETDGPPVESITFGPQRYRDEATGVRRRHVASRVPCRVLIDGQRTHERTLEYDETVALRLTDSEADRWSVEYLEDTRRRSLRGQTYVLERTSKGLEAVDAYPSEQATLRRDLGDLGNIHPLSALMPEAPMAVGTLVPMDPDVATRVFGTDIVRATRVEARLTGTETVDGRSCAVFDLTLEAQSTLERPRTHMMLKGRLALALDDAAPVQVSLDGVASVSGTWEESTGAIIEVVGDGVASIELTWSSDAPTP